MRFVELERGVEADCARFVFVTVEPCLEFSTVREAARQFRFVFTWCESNFTVNRWRWEYYDARYRVAVFDPNDAVAFKMRWG